VQQFKHLLESIGKTYDSNLSNFKIENGVVAFNFDKEDFKYNIYENISDVIGVHPRLFDMQRGVGEYVRWINWSNAKKNKVGRNRNPVSLPSLN